MDIKDPSDPEYILDHVLKNLDFSTNKYRAYNIINKFIEILFGNNDYEVYTEVSKKTNKFILYKEFGKCYLYVDILPIGLSYHYKNENLIVNFNNSVINKKFREVLQIDKKEYYYFSNVSYIHNDIFKENQYFSDMEKLKFEKTFYLNYLNTLTLKEDLDIKWLNYYIFDNMGYNYTCEKTDNKYLTNLTGEIMDVESFNELGRFKSLNIVEISKFFIDTLNISTNVILTYSVVQNFIKFDSLIEKISSFKTQEKEKSEVEEFNKESKEFNKHEILQFISFDDIKNLVLE